MNELVEECEKLNLMLRNSHEYKRYHKALSNLRRNSELYEEYIGFVQKNEEIQIVYQENALEELQRLYSDYDEMLHNSVVNEFIRAERRFFALLKEMLGAVASGVDIVYHDDFVEGK